MQPDFPYHLSARSNGKDWFALETHIVWEIMSEYLHFVHHSFNARIHLFVLMDNHFHMIASFPDGNLSAAMNYLMRETSRAIGRYSNRINHVFGARTFRSCLGDQRYFEHAYKYTYRNPVEAALCARVEEYPFSTLHGLLGLSHEIIPVEEDTLMFDRNVTENLEWLNHAPSKENRDAIRRALKHPNFKLPHHKSSKRRHPLESNRY